MASLYARAAAKARHHLRCRVYNLGYRIAGSIDGYPLPPSRLVRTVIGTRELAWYQLGGMFFQQSMNRMLCERGVRLHEAARILDFGCGCGRVLRWLGGLAGTVELHGTDYNPALIAWCRRRLAKLGTFHVNAAEPPLDFPDGHFDFVFSYSVFTHLRHDLQRRWLDELVRVTRPGGHLLATFHGATAFAVPRAEGRFDAAAGEAFGRGRPQYLKSAASGANVCGAYHPEAFVRGELAAAAGLDVLDHLPHGTRDASDQDVYLFRKPLQAAVAA